MNKDKLIHSFYISKLVSLPVAEQIAAHFEHKFIAKGSLHLDEGKICDEYFFLEKGYIRAFVHDIEGNEVTTGLYQSGDVVFEVSSFFSRSKSKENIVALSHCEGWVITFEQLNSLFHSIPEFREFGRSVLVKGFAKLKTRMLSMITETAEQRYAQLLKSSPDLFQHVPLKNIASYLGMTDTSLSRIRKDVSKR